MRRYAITLILGLSLTSFAYSQPRTTVGVGVGVAPLWGPFGYFPSVYDGFYMNGFSLYGPPVPTGGPIPGYFGGSQQRFGGNPNSMFWPSVGVGVAVPLNRRRAPASWEHEPPLFWQEPSVRPLPHLKSRELDASELPLPQPTEPTPMTLELIVPPTAVVRINDQPTQLTGTSRMFQSPPIQPGGSFSYDIEVSWMSGKTPIRQRREVDVHAGQKLRLDFTQPALPSDGR